MTVLLPVQVALNGLGGSGGWLKALDSCGPNEAPGFQLQTGLTVAIMALGSESVDGRYLSLSLHNSDFQVK